MSTPTPTDPWAPPPNWSAPSSGPNAPAPKKRRSPLRVIAWTLTGVFVLLAALFACTAVTSAVHVATNPPPTEQSAPAPAAPAPVAQAAPEPAPAPAPAPAPVAPAPAPEPAAPAGIESGKYEIGVEMAPGKYKTPGPDGSGMCYHARLSATDNGGTVGDIIDNNISQGPDTVTVKKTDGFFETSGCQPWVKVG
jgi:hypothetical protein